MSKQTCISCAALDTYFTAIKTATYIVRFLLDNWQVFLFDFSRPISTVTFRCTRTISISGKWNYLNVLSYTSIISCCCSSWVWFNSFIHVCSSKCLLKQCLVTHDSSYKHYTNIVNIVINWTQHRMLLCTSSSTLTRGQSNLTKSASQLGVTPGGRKLYHWIPGVGFPISVP